MASSSRSGRYSATSPRIVGVWLPWPGKSSAVPVATSPFGGGPATGAGVDEIAPWACMATDNSPNPPPVSRVAAPNPPIGGAGAPTRGIRRAAAGPAPCARPRRGCGRRACGRSRCVWSLTVCGLRCRLAAVSRLVAPLAISSSTSISRSLSAAAPAPGAVGEHLGPERDHAHGLDHVGGAPVLGDEPGGSGGARHRGRDPSCARDQQHLRLRRGLADLLADLRAGLAAQQQIDQGDVGAHPRGERDRVLPAPGDLAARDPGLAAEQQPEAPVDDVVVVDDQHPDRVALSRHRSAPAASPASRSRRRGRTPAGRCAGAPRG